MKNTINSRVFQYIKLIPVIIRIWRDGEGQFYPGEITVTCKQHRIPAYKEQVDVHIDRW